MMTRMLTIVALTIGIISLVGSQAPPGKVGSLRVRSVSSSELRATWTPPSGHAYPIDQYYISYKLVEEDRCLSSPNFERQAYGAVVDTTVTIGNLKSYSTYEIIVSAVSSAGQGEEDTDEGTTRSGVPSGPPDSVQSTNAGTSTLDFSWNEVPCGSRGGFIVGYRYELHHDGSDDVITDDVTDKSVSVNSLIAGVEYRFRVAARTSRGAGVYSDDVVASTILTVPGLVQEFSATVTSSTSITVSWEPPVIPADTYNIDIKLTNRDQCLESETFPKDFYTSTSDTTVTVDNLIPYSTYTFYVKAINSEGESGEETVLTTTAEDVPSESPQNIENTASASTSLTLQWTQIACGDRNGNIIAYEYKLFDSHSVMVSTDQTTGTSLTINNLIPNMVYRFRVAGLTSAGIGVFSTDNDFATSVEGALRFMDSSSDSEGYLEIYVSNQWNHVCHDVRWDRTDAVVACRQLGFNDENRVQLLDGISSGSGLVAVGSVQCSGSESALIGCQLSSGSSAVTCPGNLKAGVTCDAEIDECMSYPCQNDGTCVDMADSYQCQCLGFEGINCESDIDECQQGTHGCHANADCTNSFGNYSCSCTYGYSGDGFTCNDVNECNSNLHNCNGNARCTNTNGGFTCDCNDGYEGDGINCNDINECFRETDNCHVNAECLNTDGNFTCSCRDGFSGNGFICNDVNECNDNSNNCHVNAACSNTIGSYTCSCTDGFEGDGANCNEITECSSTPCQNQGTCEDLVNGYQCRCIDGFDGVNCENNINECLSSPCRNEAACIDEVNGYSCNCMNGYTGPTCAINIDECSSNPCVNEGTCVDKVNGYTCRCVSGFIGQTCEHDIQECSNGEHSCDSNAFCTNTHGSYDCTCLPGYTGDGFTCTDINECSSTPCANGGMCYDGIDIYRCICKPGFMGTNCEQDFNECASNPCQHNGVCNDQINQYNCSCQNGYTGTNCQTDVDECTTSTHNCDENAQCSNTFGSFTCQCQNGYDGDGVTCNDIDECMTNTHGCNENAVCNNTVGSFSCECNPGYEGDGTSCTEIDECNSSPCLNGGICVDGDNGYTCFCQVSHTGTNCEINFNECGSSPCLNGGYCLDRVNGYTCYCQVSYTGTHCETDTRPCASSPCAFGGTCVNINNNEYSCHCDSGLMGPQCTDDVDECSTGQYSCNDYAECANTFASYSCVCPEGYTQFGNGKNSVCYDKDECLMDTDNCDIDAACTNTAGNFTCECNTGYTGNGVACEDTDECTSGMNNCHENAVCQNTMGSFSCSCQEGFAGNGIDCNDIDECFDSVSRCDNNAMCNNTVGSFSCMCNSGYNGNGVQCDDIDECSDGSSNCDPNAACNNTMGSFTCECMEGFAGNGEQCFDNDECTSNLDNCNIDATCTNTPGSFDCTCNEGYTGNGIICDEIRECVSGPCMNGGTCMERLSGYDCDCADGFTGSNCEQEINECESSPCRHGGTCSDKINSYQCTCAPGFIGAQCETDLDECASYPCRNNGTCTDLINGYQCSCADGFTGMTCQIDIDECDSSPCINGATCIDMVNNVQCTCASGYTGRVCDIDINECASLPCENGGSCTDQVDGHFCTCSAGYQGARCHLEIDECGSHPCRNGGTCVDQTNSFQCRCPGGYTGLQCEQDINECEDVPCQNNGICIDMVNNFRCECLAGFTGSICQTNVNECFSSPCRNDAICRDLTDEFQCDCLDGFDGILCETDINECASRPCQNGGFCVDTVNGFACACLPEYTGTICNEDVNECNTGMSNCDINARCENTFGGFRCICNNGYEGNGEQCVDADECPGNPLLCHTNAVCINTVGSYRCECNAGYTGNGVICDDVDECARGLYTCDSNADCQNTVGSYRCICHSGFGGNGHTCTDVDECGISSSACDPNASCRNSIGSFTCICNNGYMGDGQTCSDFNECVANTATCDPNAWCRNSVGGYECICNIGYTESNQRCIDVDECTTGMFTCHPHAGCDNTYGSYTCSCNRGFTGDGDECNDIDECANNAYDCNINAECENTVGSFSCVCNDGYTGNGIICEEIRECFSQPCMHGSACLENVNGYVCECADGYDGTHCEHEIDECLSSPCVNGGQCQEMVAGYQCGCLSGFTGLHCEIDINECTSSPCLNGGRCEDMITGYTCSCLPGFEGERCDIDIDECSSSPCENGGSCTDTVNGYQCNCADGYMGQHCEQDINECASEPCQNEGSCIDRVNSYDCNCLGGFSGPLCELNINECASEPCHNGGSCADRVNGYDCNCLLGFHGLLCELDKNECTDGTHNCDLNAVCTNSHGSHVCTCNTGYQGDGFSCIDINECMSSPCMNGGRCEDMITGYTCRCLPGFEGERCENDIDECSSSPCENGGVCTDTVNGYQCNCADGYMGQHCDQDINECDNTNTCDDSATCTNIIGGFICRCNTGYEGNGLTCSDINECASDPCHNGGTCMDRVNGYDCICLEGFNGILCELDKNECTTGTHNCDRNAVCTNSHGSHVCTCNIGYQGDGYSCSQCEAPFYGEMCQSDCPCVLSSSCHHITGECTCTPQFEGAVCDKGDFDITAEVLEDIIVEEERVELLCNVNLPSQDIIDNTVVWTTPHGQRLESKQGDGGGTYVATLEGVSATNNGRYTCTARTEISTGNRIIRTDTVDIEVYDKPKVDITDSSAINSTAILVTWALPYDKMVPINNCKMSYRQGMTGSWMESSTEIDPEVLHYTISGLQPNTEYSIQFMCTSQFGEIPNIVGGVRTPETLPSEPVNVASDDLPSYCVVSWNEPESPNGIITHYTVYYTILARTANGVNTNDTKTSYAVIDDISSTQYNITKAEMMPYSRYEFTVSATTSAGEGGVCQCPEVVCETLPAAPSDVFSPRAVGGVNKETNTYMIELVPSSDRNGPVSCYEVIIFPYAQQDFVVGPSQDPDELFPPDRIGSYADNNGAAGSLYVAFVISGSSLTEPMTITIGDGKKTQCMDTNNMVQRKRRNSSPGIPPSDRFGENGALTPGLTYTAFLRAYSMVDDNQVQYSSSSFMDPVTIPPATPPDNQPNSGFQNSLVLYVVVGSIAFVIILVCLIAVCISCRHRSKKRMPFKNQGPIDATDYEMQIRRTGSIAPLLHSIELNEKRLSEIQLNDMKRASDASLRYQEQDFGAANETFNPDLDYTYIDDEATDYRILWEQLMLGQNILGTGTYGDVVEGVVFKKNKNIVKVAVKKSKTSEPDTDPTATSRKDFIAEFEMMKKIGYHPNVVTLIGTCNHEGFMYVATELASKGDLRSFLRNSRRTHLGQSTSTIPSQQLLRFSVDVAAGMEHLASKGIIHRDLAARNILLSEALTAKISDFGLSRGEDTYVKQSKARIPVRWMALESLEHRKYTIKSDVWSFGILMWEIATLGGTPYPNEDPKYMIPLLKSGYRMSKPHNCSHELFVIMTECWDKDPDKRPPFDELTPKLFRMLEDETTYLSVTPKTGFKFEPINSKYAEP